MENESPYTCPHCDANVPLPDDMNEWSTMANGPFPCPACGKMVELDGDYASEGSWWFALQAAD